MGLKPLLLLLSTLTLAAAGPEQALFKADQDFDRATAERGLEGWMSFFADDAILNAPRGPVRGKEALRTHYAAMFAQKDFSIRWKPFHAEMSKDGTFGYTLGTAQISWTGPDGPVKREGRYLTVWRKLPDGSWRAVSDMGN